MIEIPRHIYEDMIAHAVEGFPLEVCGILSGTPDKVATTYRMTNTDASNEHFMMDPKEQFAVVKELRSENRQMVAIYHSHPETPARPSEEDIRLALTPNVSYIIISLADTGKPDMKSFKIHNGNVMPEEIIVA